jgi:hypothetical protein
VVHKVLVLLLVGCAHGEATRLDSQSLHPAATPIERMLVIVDLDGTPIADAMTTGLQRCGVTATIVYRDPLELEPGARLRTVIAEVQPTAALTIQPTGGQLGDSTRNQRDYELAVRELAPERTIWRAAASVNAEMTNTHFADQVVAKLRTDGVLVSCRGGAS